MKVRSLLRLMIPSVSLAAFSFAADAPPGGSSLQAIEWKEASLPPESSLLQKEAKPGRGLSIKHTAKAPVSIPVWTTTDPKVQAKCFAIRGKIRYKDVEGTGYLEMWSSFPEAPGSPAGKYFSRTLGEVAGPMQKITGSSEWRPVLLPFDATESKTFPNRLDVNVVLGGAGTVELADLELVQFADRGAMWAPYASLGRETHTPPSPNATKALAFAGAGVAVAGGIAYHFARRRNAEERRMRAMDLR